MRHRKVVDLPLHGGRAPRWLMQRMVQLGGAILEALREEWGPDEILRRLSHPLWFQALGNLLGFDWHSSGLTTTVTGALKEALRQRPDLGLYAAGGKGARSRRTPEELRRIGERTGLPADRLIRISRLVAKVDSAALQDGFQLYHHTFWVSESGAWAVIQQGMHPERRRARRYHWVSFHLRSYVEEPHAGVVSEMRAARPLNLVHQKSAALRALLPRMVREPPHRWITEIHRLPARHPLLPARDLRPRNLERLLRRWYAEPPEDFVALLLTPGAGARALRALVLLAELVYGTRAAYEDPFLFAFAHGGKDGTPFPVDRGVYDHTLAVLEQAVRRARMGHREQLEALRRLARWSARVERRFSG